MGRHDEASRECRRATELRPDDWRGHTMLGYLRYSRGDFGDALEPWRAAARLSPENATAARNHGSVLFRLDRFEEAIAEWVRSLELQPNASALTNLGTAQFFLGRYAEAAGAFERAAALAPADPIKWGNLGNALRLVPGRVSEAAPALERAVGLMRERLDRHPADPRAWARMAGWLVNLGKLEDAESAIREALRQAGDDSECLWHAGHVFFQLGRREDALNHLRRAADRGVGARALATSPDLADLRGDPEFEALLRAARKDSAAEEKRS
jgi:Flp pilus assembly protein TadD